MRLSKTQFKLTLSCLVLALVGCQSMAMTHHPVNCKPTPPQLEWYNADHDGVYYPSRSVTNLQLYIEQLNHCIDELTQD